MTRAHPLLLCLLLALAACQAAKPTAYGPVTATSEYGYKDQKLDERTWRVSVAGNSHTDRDLVENQLLYRAAEIALANGADGFVVLDRDIDRDVKYRTTYNPYYAYPYGGFWVGRPYYDPFTRRLYPPGFGPWGFYGFGGYSAGAGMIFGPPARATTQAVTRYTAYAEVQLYKGTPPEGQGAAYDAQELSEQLADKVNKPKPGKS